MFKKVGNLADVETTNWLKMTDHVKHQLQNRAGLLSEAVIHSNPIKLRVILINPCKKDILFNFRLEFETTNRIFATVFFGGQGL